MHFLWPHSLWLLAVAALLPVAYRWLTRRRTRAALAYSDLGTVRAAAGRGWRRHVPPALALLALAVLLLAAARPVARVPLPWARTSILLAMDVSLSMRVGDVKPTRMVAAQEAAKAFLREVPPRIEIGLVTFAGSAHVAQRATLDRAALVASIDAFQMQLGTAVGDAIVQCLAEIFPDHGIDLGRMMMGGTATPSRGRSLDERARPQPAAPDPVPPGSHDAAAIILLSDGRRTAGIDTLAAARMAADRGVRVHVIGLGTVDGDAATPEGMAIYMKLDEPTLREVARMTGGQYHHAGTAENLRGVYQELGSRVEVLRRETELAGPLALAAALLASVAALLSLLWSGRLR
ncbi:VWA domain-containing protein (plasmid) [Comamonadaceae bacterium OTU4NAUVB1]|nr:VWA domain-containing protein [Comamonadaceae bacterium OTU4NAUVB1]